MKKYIPFLSFFLISVLAVNAFYFINTNKHKSGKKTFQTIAQIKKKHPKKQRVEDMLKWWTDLKKDLTLGYVPQERLAEAYNVFLRKKRALNDRSAGILNGKWHERGPYRVGGRTRAILVDLNDANRKKIWTGGVAGGLWVCNDVLAANPVFTPVNDTMMNLSVVSIDQNKTNPQIMFYATGDMDGNDMRGMGVFRSTNGGVLWSRLVSSSVMGYQISKLMVHKNGDVYVAAQNGTYKSTNNGDTWEKVNNAVTWDVEQGINGEIYISGPGYVKKSASGNANTWTDISPIGFQNTTRSEIAVSKKTQGVIYVVKVVGADATNIYKTFNDGQTWAECGMAYRDQARTEVFTRGQGWYDLTLEIDPNNDNRLFLGGIDKYVTSNGGLNWSRFSDWVGASNSYQYIHADQHGVTFEPGNSNVIYYSGDGGLFTSRNAAAEASSIKVKMINDNYNITQFYHCAMASEEGSNMFLAGAQDNGSHYFNETGKENTEEVTGGDGGFVHIDQNEPNIRFTSYVYHAYYMTKDGGLDGYAGNGLSLQGGDFINATDYDSENNVFYGAHSTARQVLRWYPTSGQGDDYSFITVSALQTATASYVYVSPNISSNLYLLASSRIVKVENANNRSLSSFTGVNLRKTNMPSGSPRGINIERGNESHIIVTYSNYGTQHVWETLDGGENWQNISGDLPDIPVYAVLINPNNNRQAIIGTELGVWATENIDGANTVWQPMYNGIPNTIVTNLEIRASDNFVIASTFGRGLWSSDVFTLPKALYATQRVQYTNANMPFNEYSFQASSWYWNFGDGTNSTVPSPLKSFANAGYYDVTLTINNGESNLTKNIHVLPYKPTEFVSSTTNYNGDFESNPDDFGVEHISGTSWQRGNSTITGKNGTHSGQNAWVTGLNEALHSDNSLSYLYMPDFNFSDSAIYEVSFWSKFKFERTAGIQLQYSTDKGVTWKVLGTSSGNSWYNNSVGSFGAFASGTGYFSGTQTTFKEYKTDISYLGGNTSVAFRFVFSALPNSRQIGGAIDDFQIRKRTVSESILFNELSVFTGSNEFKTTWSVDPQFKVEKFEIYSSENSVDYTVRGEVIPMSPSSLVQQDYSYTSSSSGIFRRSLYFIKIKMKLQNGREVWSKVMILRRNSSGSDVYNVYPTVLNSNLGSENIRIQFSEIINSTVKADIFDANGKMVYSANAESNSALTVFSIPALSSGVYFMKLEWDGKKEIRKIVFTNAKVD